MHKTFTLTMKQILIALAVLALIGFVLWENTKKVSFSDVSFDTPEAQEAGVQWVNISIVELQNRARQYPTPANPQ